MDADQHELLINSKGYWDRRFAGDWQAKQGAGALQISEGGLLPPLLCLPVASEPSIPIAF